MLSNSEKQILSCFLLLVYKRCLQSVSAEFKLYKDDSNESRKINVENSFSSSEKLAPRPSIHGGKLHFWKSLWYKYYKAYAENNIFPQSVSECLMNFVRRFFRRAQDEIWIHTRRKWSALIQNSKRAPGACSCFQLTLGALIDECGISCRFHVAPNIQNMTISLVKRKQLEQTVVLSLSSGRKIIHIDKSQSALSCDVE